MELERGVCAVKGEPAMSSLLFRAEAPGEDSPAPALILVLEDEEMSLGGGMILDILGEGGGRDYVCFSCVLSLFHINDPRRRDEKKRSRVGG